MTAAVYSCKTVRHAFVVILWLMACSQRRHGRDKTVLSSRVGGVNTTADKTRQFCLVRVGGVNKPLRSVVLRATRYTNNLVVHTKLRYYPMTGVYKFYSYNKDFLRYRPLLGKSGLLG